MMQKCNNQKIYNELYSKLGKQHRDFPTKKAFVKRLHQLGLDIEAKKVIEFGCGIGNESVALRNITGWSVTPTDISQEMLKNLPIDLTGEMVDVKNPYSFPQRKFDLAFCSFLIHLLSKEEKRQFYKCVHNTLSSHGIFVILTASEIDLEKRRVTYYFPSSLDIDMKRYLTIKENKDLLLEAGFFNTTTEQIRMPEMHNKNELLMLENKDCSVVRLLPEKEYRIGMEKLKIDMKNKSTIPSKTKFNKIKWNRTLIIAFKSQ